MRMKSLIGMMLLGGVLAAGTPAGAADGGMKIVTSFYPVYIMALNVAQGVPGVTVENLTPSQTGCLHDYALTADDMKKLAEADLLVLNGAGMESFLGKVMMQYPQLKRLELSDGLSLITDKQGVPNPHVWLRAANAARQVKNLGRILQYLDAGHAEIYKANTDAYVGRLEALEARMKQDLAPYKGKAIVTFHEAFPYLAQGYGLKIAAVVEREPGSEPSAQELAQTIDLVKQSGVKALFSEPQYSDKAAKTIARETKAKVYTLDPAVTGPDDPNAYLDIMEKNLATLKKALK